MKHVLSLSLCLCFSAAAFAAGPEPAESRHPLEIQFDKCVEVDPSTAGMHQCIDTFMPKWDALLNKYYAQLGGDKNPQLRQAQLAWIKYRDTETAWIQKKYDLVYSQSGGGTMWGLLEHGELMNIVKRRALELMHDWELLSTNKLD